SNGAAASNNWRINVPRSSLDPRDFDDRLVRTCAPMSNFIQSPNQAGQTNVLTIPINSGLPKAIEDPGPVDRL
ncbi:hypothetical protein AADR41_41440, partial [Streptomyces sp. CLV115]|uniref:hypothetical protein n=1 Tax=Streptomyces sp. CLV115 TaxID=3138502 RepID=UPI00313F3B66